MAIQVTPIPRLTVLTVPAFTLGTANAAGDAISAVASNSTLLAFDATNPADVSTTAAVGTATVTARRDHVHAGGVGLAKAYCTKTTAGALDTGSYNVASITDNSTGNWTVVFDTDFANVDYVSLSALSEASVNEATIFGATQATASQRYISTDGAGTEIDISTWHVFFGVQ
jgi:hypothetical protein